MTMKLSKKGLLKILDACYFDKDYDQYVLRSLNRKENLFEIQDTTFEADDFKDSVILSVEEAKEIFWLLVGCWWEEEDCEEKELRLNEKWRELLPNLIEQAEVQNEIK